MKSPCDKLIAGMFEQRRIKQTAADRHDYLAAQ